MAWIHNARAHYHHKTITEWSLSLVSSQNEPWCFYKTPTYTVKNVTQDSTGVKVGYFLSPSMVDFSWASVFSAPSKSPGIDMLGRVNLSLEGRCMAGGGGGGGIQTLMQFLKKNCELECCWCNIWFFGGRGGGRNIPGLSPLPLFCVNPCWGWHYLSWTC